jgi:tetratricopeptide (TPR) repeat protein
MFSVSEAMASAIAHHQAGRLEQAEAIYREVLTIDPDCVDAWNLLGVMASQTGRFDHAVTLIGQALRLRPEHAEFHYNLAFALQGQGILHAAEAAYRRTLEMDPNHVRAFNGLGNLLQQQGKLEEAANCHRVAVSLSPVSPEVHFNLGNDLKAQEKWNEAIACYEQALRLNPTWGQVHSNLGDALQGRGDWSGAVASYRRALEALPNSAQVHSNLGSAWEKLREWDRATACYYRAVELAPDLVEARLNLGSALHHQGDLDAADQHFRHVLRRDANNPHAHNSLGLVLRDQGRMDEARRSFERAIELKPEYAEAHTNHAMLLLADGEFEQGWPEYQWRWKTKETFPRYFAEPLWDGQRLEGKTILLHAEQGLGDTIQFIRYASLVKALGPTVIVESQAPLAPLLASCSGIDKIVAPGEQLPPFDTHAPLLSLPGILKTTLTTVPANCPYLCADANLVEQWRTKLKGLEGFRIGINWRGRTGQGMFRRRDIPPACLSVLAQPNTTLVSLQKDATRQELDAIHSQIVYPGDDVDQTHGPFMDTAAIMRNIDLVITSDTSTAHLAGALEIPTWIALPYVASWQWMRSRGNSPWYPTARLFRQRVPDDWNGVFEEIRGELNKLLPVRLM